MECYFAAHSIPGKSGAATRNGCKAKNVRSVLYASNLYMTVRYGILNNQQSVYISFRPLMIEERSITSPPKYVKQISITDDDESQLVKLEEMTQAPTVSFPSNHTNEIIVRRNF